MATKATISFTALPNGVVDGPGGKKVRLSVLVSPRLSTEPITTENVDLSQFPDWENWPSTPVTFGVSFNGGPAVEATPVGTAPIGDLWQMLFSSNSPTTPHAFDTAVAATKIPLTYSVKDVHAKIRDVYTYFAKTTPENFPTVTQLIRPPSPLADLATLALPVQHPISDIPPGPARANGGVVASVMAVTAADTFKKVQTFHAPFNPLNRITPTPPDIDFHQMLSALGRYPFLMRLLGLV